MANKIFRKVMLSLFIAMFGSVGFMAVYYYANSAYIGFYGHNSCTASANIGSLVTAPINYCEDTSSVYNNLNSGIINNMEIPAIIIFFAILYYLLFAQKSRNYLQLSYTILIAIGSTYLLSGLNLWINGSPVAGTSIIAFDTLLFLAISLVVDYIWISKLIKDETSRIYVYLQHSINYARAKFAKLNKLKVVTHREIKILLGTLYIGATLATIYMFTGYIFNQSATLHLYGGGLFLLAIILINSKKLISSLSSF